MRTLPILFLPLLCFVLTVKVFADDDVSKIKAAYEAAVKRATDPLKATYVKELQKLLQKQTQAGKLEEAAKAMAELQAIQRAAVPIADEDADAKQGLHERWFVRHTWKTATGSFFTFDPSGGGTRVWAADKAPFVWQVKPDGLIEVLGEARKGAGMQTLFFRFESGTVGFFGDSRAKVNLPLERQ